MTAANTCLKLCNIEVWGRARRVDSTEGDTFRASGLGSRHDDTRDASFVRYEMLVDKNAHRPRQKAVYEPKTFYGQLQLIYVVRIPLTALRHIREVSEAPITLILVGIRRCNIDEANSASFAPLDIHIYSTMGQFDVIDITSVQSLVGRLKAAGDDREWAIIDRSGSLARAVFDAEEDE
ncbi:hypothetical protein H0H93_010661 [Arthromyces matolae]|nr:hypothetical protein H0H93_010661 [Arthromyces matolae]